MRHRLRKRPMAEINVVPYIDVMLVLLVIFMITAPLLSQGIQVELPKVPSEPLTVGSSKGSGDSSKYSGIDNLIITVDEAGSFFINYGEDQEKPISAENLVKRVAALMKYQPGLPVLIRGDTNAKYGRVASLMAALQSANVSSIGMITESPEH